MGSRGSLVTHQALPWLHEISVDKISASLLTQPATTRPAAHPETILQRLLGLALISDVSCARTRFAFFLYCRKSLRAGAIFFLLRRLSRHLLNNCEAAPKNVAHLTRRSGDTDESLLGPTFTSFSVTARPQHSEYCGVSTQPAGIVTEALVCYIWEQERRHCLQVWQFRSRNRNPFARAWRAFRLRSRRTRYHTHARKLARRLLLDMGNDVNPATKFLPRLLITRACLTRCISVRRENLKLNLIQIPFRRRQPYEIEPLLKRITRPHRLSSSPHDQHHRPDHSGEGVWRHGGGPRY